MPSAQRADTMVGPRRSHSVKSMPNATGKQLWNTMAPVIFPSASVSFFLPTQMTEFTFSGSSVAIGVMMSESRSGEATR